MDVTAVRMGAEVVPAAAPAPMPGAAAAAAAAAVAAAAAAAAPASNAFLFCTRFTWSSFTRRYQTSANGRHNRKKQGILNTVQEKGREALS
jgi:Na+/proline symporter